MNTCNEQFALYWLQMFPPTLMQFSMGPQTVLDSEQKMNESQQNHVHEISCNLDVERGDRIGESARNRFGRPYISGRPLLLCDRKKIIRLYREGRRKIAIAREIGITHSCVSKVIRRFEETGELENKNSRTASCACPGEAENHDVRICRHVRFNRIRAEQQTEMMGNCGHQIQQKVIASKTLEPKRFSIEWHANFVNFKI